MKEMFDLYEQREVVKALELKVRKLEEEFLKEKRAKNDAYYFIASKGLFEDFGLFLKEYRGDSFSDTVRLLYLRSND